MADVWRSFWKGWRSAGALWPVVLLLYLVDTALALVLAIPPGVQLAQLFGRSTMAAELLGPYSLDWVIETTDGGDQFTFPWPLLLLVPLLSLLVGTFLRGGTLAALAAGPAEFRWVDFFSDCARFFGRFLLLLFLFVPGLLAVGLAALVARLILGLLPVPEAAGSLGLVAILAFSIFLLLAVLDYARISLVLDPERPTARHVGRSVRFVVGRFPRVVLLGLGFALAAALIAAAYPALLQLSPFFDTFVAGLVAQQSVILLATWQRVAQLGGEMALYRGVRAGPSGATR